MRCADAEGSLTRLFDGDLDDVQARQLRAHLVLCKQCRELSANLLWVEVMTSIAREHWGSQMRTRTRIDAEHAD